MTPAMNELDAAFFRQPFDALANRSRIDSFQARSLSRSILGSPKSMPRAADSFASRRTAVACSSALEGMQPLLRQIPPKRGLCSTKITFLPRSAA